MALTAGAQKSVLLYSGLNPQVVEIMVDDDATANMFYDGDCVSVESTGQVILAIAGAVDVIGIARRAAVTADNTPIPVELIDPHAIYTARVNDTATTSEAYIGDCADFVFTTGAQYLAISSATTDTYIVGLHPVDGAKLGGRVLFRWNYAMFSEQF